MRSNNGFLWNEHVCCKIYAKIKCQWESYPYVAYLKISVGFSLLLSFTFSGTWILQKRSPIDRQMLFPFPSVYQDYIHGLANRVSLLSAFSCAFTNLGVQSRRSGPKI